MSYNTTPGLYNFCINSHSCMLVIILQKQKDKRI